MATEEVTRRAARVLRAAGRTHLAPAGARPNSSGRRWIIDRGWWLINIEFQPSSYQIGSFLNVGLQHLWLPRDHGLFEYESRQRDIGGLGSFVSFEVDDDAASVAADTLGRAARAAADRWLSLFADDRQHLDWLTGHVRDGHDEFNAAFAFARLGRRESALRAFTALADRLAVVGDTAWEADLGRQARDLATELAVDETLATQFFGRVADSRRRLRLP